MTTAARRLVREDPGIEVICVGDPGTLAREAEDLPSLPVGPFDGSLRSAGAVSVDAIRTAVGLALADEVDAIATGPVHKPALHDAGTVVPGQTELLQELTGVPEVGMLMASESTRVGGPFRVLLATTHLPLRAVPDALTRERIERQVRLLHRGLRDGWGIPSPRIILCALNPHASDGGLFGDEEARVFEPAVEALRAEGLDVRGPLPADTAFLPMIRGESDGVVVPFHDVGMAVFKTLSFGAGVNTTLGLPFPRTSPDHGTAFDLAGTGRADATSAIESIRLAARLGRSALHGGVEGAPPAL